MGAPTAPTREQEQMLRLQGEMLEQTVYTVGADGKLELDFTVPAWTIGQLV